MPPWASHRATHEARRSPGWSRYIARRIHLAGITGELLTMIVMTLGKWWLSLEVAAPHQIARCTTIAPPSRTVTSAPASRKTTSIVQ